MPKRDYEQAQEVEKLERLSDSLDSRFSLPIVDIKFGADAIIGLLPVAGDTISAVFSAYIISKAYSIGAPLEQWLGWYSTH